MPGWRNGRRRGLSACGGSAVGRKITIEFVSLMNTEDVKPATGVYVIAGDAGRYMYKGSARDLRKRVLDHIEGRVARTRNRRPLKLVFVEYTNDYSEARKRENWLKSGQGRDWLRDNYAWVAEWQTQGT